MSRELWASFMQSHTKNYAAIGRACIRHNVNVRLGECPNEIIVIGDMPKLFRDYMRKCQPDFALVKG